MQRLNDVVILLPGITGSVLQKDKHDLWAVSLGATWNLLRTPKELLLGDDDPELDHLDDGIRATQLIPDVHLIPGLIKIDGYSEIARMITKTFRVLRSHIGDDKPANFIEFPYDWRRDNRVAARQLQTVADRMLHAWRKYTGNDKA
jgi:hypothetical protein